MAANEDFPQTGLVVAGDDEPSDKISEFTYPILDDIFYNIVHDICVKTHRDEKLARATSAAIIVEKKAEETNPNSHDDDDDSTNDVQLQHTAETDGAKYVNGAVYLRGNPLQTTKDILCPKCKRPRLLHPTDGNGARKPEPGVEYCKKPYFIEKEHFDIYGQLFQQEGPGRGKKKKDMINPLKAQTVKEGTPTGSQDSTPPPIEEKKAIQFPSSKCLNCNSHIPIRRMNNHMVKCIGGGGRDSSRNALAKIQNGNGGGSQNGTPPGSRNGTPAPGTNGKIPRSSPNKRSPPDDSGSDTPQKKKKIIKKTAATKLKALKLTKTPSQHSASNLSFESKVPASDEEDEDNDDDDGDGEYGTVIVEPKKKSVLIAKKMKELKNQKRWKLGKGGVQPHLPAIVPPGVAKVKKNGKVDEPAKSESPGSSQTLSSPN